MEVDEVDVDVAGRAVYSRELPRTDDETSRVDRRDSDVESEVDADNLARRERTSSKTKSVISADTDGVTDILALVVVAAQPLCT